VEIRIAGILKPLLVLCQVCLKLGINKGITLRMGNIRGSIGGNTMAVNQGIRLVRLIPVRKDIPRIAGNGKINLALFAPSVVLGKEAMD